MRPAFSQKGHVLRIVGIADVARSRCSIQLRSYPTDHPLGALGAPGQDVVTVSTARFANLPLVIRGPSHGAEVAAASVFSDLLRLANHLGATM